MNFDPLESLKKINNSLYEKMNLESKDAFSKGEIPIKYKFLIAMALDAAHGAENGVTALANQAIENGATKQEIAEVLAVLHHVSGGGSIYAASVGLSRVKNL